MNDHSHLIPQANGIKSNKPMLFANGDEMQLDVHEAKTLGCDSDDSLRSALVIISLENYAFEFLELPSLASIHTATSHKWSQKAV